MTAVWLTVGALCLATIAIKAAGPVLVGGRHLPPRVSAVIAVLAPALLAALVVTETFERHGQLALDARAAGLGAAAAAVIARAPLLVTVVVAAAATAAARALG